jgi:hypothetical protein
METSLKEFCLGERKRTLKLKTLVRFWRYARSRVNSAQPEEFRDLAETAAWARTMSALQEVITIRAQREALNIVELLYGPAAEPSEKEPDPKTEV